MHEEICVLGAISKRSVHRGRAAIILYIHKLPTLASQTPFSPSSILVSLAVVASASSHRRRVTCRKLQSDAGKSAWHLFESVHPHERAWNHSLLMEGQLATKSDVYASAVVTKINLTESNS